MIFTTAAAGTNRLHRVTCATRSIQFDDRAALPWPTMGMFPKAAVGDLGVLVAAKGAEGYHGDLLVGGQLIVGNDRGAWQVLSPTIGKACVGIETDGPDRFRVAAIVSASRWAIWSVSYDLSDIRLVAAIDDPKCAGQDWLDFQDGVPVWTNDQPSVVLGGVVLWSVMRRGRWSVGLSDRANGVDTYDHETERLCRVWDGETPYPPVVASLPDGSAVVAISADVPAFIPSSQFDPLWRAPVVVPEFPSTSRRLGVFLVDEPGGPCWSAVGYVVEPRTVAVFHDVGRMAYPATQAMAESLALPVLAYVDRAGYDASERPPGARCLVQAYRQPGEGLDAFRSRLTGTVDALFAAGLPVDLCGRAYLGARSDGTTACTPQQVLDAMRVIWDLACARSIGSIWWFADQRADGVSAYPALRTAIERMRRASADWTFQPGAAAVSQPSAPSVIPAPVIQPVPSPVVNEDDMPRLTEQEKPDAFAKAGRVAKGLADALGGFDPQTDWAQKIKQIHEGFDRAGGDGEPAMWPLLAVAQEKVGGADIGIADVIALSVRLRRP